MNTHNTKSYLVFRIDLSKNFAEITLFFKRIDINSRYEIDGKISVLPIKGKGPAKLGFGKNTCSYNSKCVSFIFKFIYRWIRY